VIVFMRGCCFWWGRRQYKLKDLTRVITIGYPRHVVFFSLDLWWEVNMCMGPGPSYFAFFSFLVEHDFWGPMITFSFIFSWGVLSSFVKTLNEYHSLK